MRRSPFLNTGYTWLSLGCSFGATLLIDLAHGMPCLVVLVRPGQLWLNSPARTLGSTILPAATPSREIPVHLTA